MAKIKSKIKAGALTSNHNERMKEAGKTGKRTGVKSGVKAGALTYNHSERMKKVGAKKTKTRR